MVHKMQSLLKNCYTYKTMYNLGNVIGNNKKINNKWLACIVIIINGAIIDNYIFIHHYTWMVYRFSTWNVDNEKCCIHNVTYAFDKTLPTNKFIFSAKLKNIVQYLKVKKKSTFLLFLKKCGNDFFSFNG